MHKNTTFLVGQPIFSKIILLIDFTKVKNLSKYHKSNHYYKRFDVFQHLITMLYGVISGCNSLREVCTGIVSYGEKINHCRLNYAVPRSTLSYANANRDCLIFEKIYDSLVKEYSGVLLDSVKNQVVSKRMYAIDSTTISLFQPIFECVGRTAINGRKKGGVKSHQKLDLDLGIPIKVKHTDATSHDSLFFHEDGLLNPGEVGVFDKAYNHYEVFDNFTQKGIYFVTRLKDNAQEIFLKENPQPKNSDPNIIKDAQVKLSYKKNGQQKELTLRLITYFDENNTRFFYFLTNMFNDTAETIAHIYKKRWAIELFFKKLKQNFPLEYFYGDNKNAIKIQIWCTLIANLLLMVLMKKLTKKWSYSNFVSLLRKHLFTYVDYVLFFNHPEKFAKQFVVKKNNDPPLTQLTLFD